MICDDCGHCTKIVTEKGRVISCSILNKQEMEDSISYDHCIIWTPKKIKKRRKQDLL